MTTRRKHLKKRSQRKKKNLSSRTLMIANEPSNFSNLMAFVHITLVMLILQCCFKYSLSGSIPLWVWLPVLCAEGCWNLSVLATGGSVHTESPTGLEVAPPLTL